MELDLSAIASAAVNAARNRLKMDTYYPQEVRNRMCVHVAPAALRGGTGVFTIWSGLSHIATKFSPCRIFPPFFSAVVVLAPLFHCNTTRHLLNRAATVKVGKGEGIDLVLTKLAVAVSQESEDGLPAGIALAPLSYGVVPSLV